MGSGASEMTGLTAVAERLAGLARQDGSAAHPWPRSPLLCGGPAATRNLADAVHYLCILHGEHPGLIDIAAARAGEDPVADWLADAAYAFADERAFLARLVVAAGPIPSTPGQAECDAAVVGQRHAIEMLAQSDRNGCALGAAVGLVHDWRSVRPVLDAAAERLGVPFERSRLPDERATGEAAARASLASAGIERAMWFGAQQLIMQNRGLWDLLESRASARATL